MCMEIQTAGLNWEAATLAVWRLTNDKIQVELHPIFSISFIDKKAIKGNQRGKD